MGGTLDHRQRFYYNEHWQALEVRKEVSGTEDSDPLEQYVWHPYYIDALVLRDYDADVDGTSERHYYTLDANFNVTAVTDQSGNVFERYCYTPYAQLVVLDANFSDDPDGTSDVDNDADPQTPLVVESKTETTYLNDPNNPTGYSQTIEEITRDAAAEAVIRDLIFTLGRLCLVEPGAAGVVCGGRRLCEIEPDADRFGG